MSDKPNDYIARIEAEDGSVYAMLESGTRKKIMNTDTKGNGKEEIRRVRWADGRVVEIPKPLTWQDIKSIVDISDALMEYAEAGIIEEFLASEENFYTEVLRQIGRAHV